MTEPAPTYTTTAATPWTRAELQAELRAAGWRRLDGPAAVYRSPGGTLFNLDEYRAQVGILWHVYAALRRLPPASIDEHAPRPTPPRPAHAPKGRPPGSRNHGAPKPPNDQALAALAFIRRYKAENDGMAPTIREIGDAIDAGSTSVVTWYLNRLEACGRIRRRPGVPRWIEVLDDAGQQEAA